MAERAPRRGSAGTRGDAGRQSAYSRQAEAKFEDAKDKLQAVKPKVGQALASAVTRPRRRSR